MPLPLPVRPRSISAARMFVYAGGDVGDRATGLRRLVRRAGDRHESRLALDQQVVGLLVPVRAIRAVARDVADDEPRVAAGERFVREPQPRGGARREVLHQHVGLREQAVEDRRRLRVLDVERQALLAAVRPDEMRREPAHAAVVGAREVADAGALDLDDPGAEVGELARAERRRDRVLERDDGDAFEGKHRDLRQNERGSPSVCSATCDRIRLVEIGATW